MRRSGSLPPPETSPNGSNTATGADGERGAVEPNHSQEEQSIKVTRIVATIVAAAFSVWTIGSAVAQTPAPAPKPADTKPADAKPAATETKPADKAADKSMKKSEGKEKAKGKEKAAEKPAAKPAEKPAAKPAEKAEAKPAEMKPAEKPKTN